jgi:hypothetical protein
MNSMVLQKSRAHAFPTGVGARFISPCCAHEPCSFSFLKSNSLIAQTEASIPFLVYLVGILMTGIGIGLMGLLLEIYYKLGRKKSIAAIYLIGFGWYVTIFVIKLILPGDDGEEADDDGDTDSEHHRQ